jgi:oligopeptidase A
MCLESRVAKTPDVAIDFLENLLRDVRPIALGQFEEICQFSRRLGASDLELGDISYWSERLREEKLGFRVEELRPYFPLQKVLEGLIQLIEIVFGVKIREKTDGIDVWHPDVRYYLVENMKGEHIASFYFDPFVRPENKRSGAWMGICRYGYALSNGERSLPIAYVVCNQTPLNSEGHSLMSFEEVTTLFHEFGHALHHMLAPASWIGASPMELSEWDAIEIQSQFMEGWCYQPQVLRMISGHYKTGEVLPDYLVAALRKERSFLKGHQLLRQLHLGLTDLYIFSRKVSDFSEALKVYHEVGARTREMAPLKEDSMLCAFSHIFSGGYTAGYYSYLWSQVLSADLFGAFSVEAASGVAGSVVEWEGRMREIGARFTDKFFTRAGAVDPLKAFQDFRGRTPMNSAFLTDNGLVS